MSEHTHEWDKSMVVGCEDCLREVIYVPEHRLTGRKGREGMRENPIPLPRAFVLDRIEDETGVSGTGVVAWGVEFPDGVVALRWKSAWPTSVVFHDRGMAAVAAVHGHNGKTRIVWLDGEPE